MCAHLRRPAPTCAHLRSPAPTGDHLRPPAPVGQYVASCVRVRASLSKSARVGLRPPVRPFIYLAVGLSCLCQGVTHAIYKKVDTPAHGEASLLAENQIVINDRITDEAHQPYAAYVSPTAHGVPKHPIRS